MGEGRRDVAHGHGQGRVETQTRRFEILGDDLGQLHDHEPGERVEDAAEPEADHGDDDEVRRDDLEAGLEQEEADEEDDHERDHQEPFVVDLLEEKADPDRAEDSRDVVSNRNLGRIVSKAFVLKVQGKLN